MKISLYSGVALLALCLPGVAFAQSTGTVAAEEENEAVTVVTGAGAAKGIDGIQIPDSTKARTIIGQDYITQQTPGQSILQTLNVVPSLNFTNNDPYGSSGGNIRLRGFDGPRIAFTFDGMPLNDTGNYAIYSNQTLDPEMISETNVNQGTTDVDSATASAAGGTINYRSLTPSKEFGMRLLPSFGRFQYRRVFAAIQTGEITKMGTRAFVTASRAENDKFKGPGGLTKHQYNTRIWQPLGGNGDFVAIMGHYNKNRNNSIRAITQQQIHDYYRLGDRANYDYNPGCKRLTPTKGGVDDEAAGKTTVNGTTTQSVTQNFETIPGAKEANCTNFYNLRINPSNTWNVHGNMKLTLSDRITFTIDPSYQYVLANGGGYSNVGEDTAQTHGALGSASKGVDLNGDGDTLDTVSLYTPNTTNTHRWVVLSSVRYDVSDDHYVRLAYAFDRGWHRQTGQAGYMSSTGNPFHVFGGRDGKGPKDATGTDLRTRDRRSIAMLNQISGEYRGFFFDRDLEVQAGLRAPWFKRKLKQNCYTQYSGASLSGRLSNTGQYCSTQAASTLVILQPDETPPAGAKAANYYYAPYKRNVKWNRVLPNFGATYDIKGPFSSYANFARGMSVPRTDNLYRNPGKHVKPETSNNLDFGVRYITPKIQVSVGGFAYWFKNRIASTYDQDTGVSLDRNVGRVHSKGFEISADFRPLSWISIHNFLSYNDAKYRDNLAFEASGSRPAFVALLKGARLSDTPKWQLGAAPTVNYKGAEIGFVVKWQSKRYTTDLNDMAVAGYTTFDLNARYDLEKMGLEKTYIQLNVMNLFNKHGVGSINTTGIGASVYDGTQRISGLKVGEKIPDAAVPNMYVLSPRAISISLNFEF